MNKLTREGRAVFEDVVVHSRFDAEATWADPVLISGSELAEELIGLERRGYRMEVECVWIDWGDCAVGVSSRIRATINMVKTYVKNEENMTVV